MRRTPAFSLFAVLLLLLFPAALVQAHAELDSASPGPDEAIETVPAELVARFTQNLKKDRTSLELRDSDGQTIARGSKDSERKRVQRMKLPPLEPGRYEVRWVSFSAEDGELARGRYKFRVVAPAVAPMESPDPCSEPSPSSSPQPDVSAPVEVEVLETLQPSAEPAIADTCPEASPVVALTASPLPSASPLLPTSVPIESPQP